MELAKRVLQKYGWSEGQGLGKNLDGIRTPLKTKKKLDKAGIGHSISHTFTDNWWEAAFNSAASNIKIKTTENGVKMKTANAHSSDLSYVMKAKIPNLPEKFQPCGFLMRETLENGVVTEKVQTQNENKCAVLTDEQLFKACGGRTIHKAARHGLKLTGKLQRVREQEQALMQQKDRINVSSRSDCYSSVTEHGKSEPLQYMVSDSQNEITRDSSCKRKNKKTLKIQESDNIVKLNPSPETEAGLVVSEEKCHHYNYRLKSEISPKNYRTETSPKQKKRKMK